MNDRLKAANDGEYNNLLIVVLALAAFYLLVRGWSKSKQQTYLDNLGTDLSSQQAAALRDAMNRSGIDLLIDIDGTDVELIMQTARQITSYSAVADAYRVIYNDELTVRLQKELSRTDFITFNSLIPANAGSTTTSGGSTGSTGSSPSNVGKKVTAIQTVNLRVDNPAVNYPIEKSILGANVQAKAGDYLGTYLKEMVIPNLPNAGDKQVFIQFNTSALGGLYYVPKWVQKIAVKLG